MYTQLLFTQAEQREGDLRVEFQKSGNSSEVSLYQSRKSWINDQTGGKWGVLSARRSSEDGFWGSREG